MPGMLTLTSDAGQTWHLTDEQASNFATLVTLPPDVLASLVDLARAQAKLDSGRRVHDGAIVHVFNCRRRREADQRDEYRPKCRWRADVTAGGYACAECGTWAKPDSERARVLDRMATADLSVTCDGIVSLACTRAAETGERPGQALFNVLAGVLPGLAERIRGTEADPFYASDGNDRWANAIVAIDRHLAREISP